MKGVRVERLDHLGIVAGICREIGLAEYLDALAGPTQQQVSVGTATVAMILNGLGFSNRRLYLVAQFFATRYSRPSSTARWHEPGKGPLCVQFLMQLSPRPWR